MPVLRDAGVGQRPAQGFDHLLQRKLALGRLLQQRLLTGARPRNVADRDVVAGLAIHGQRDAHQVGLHLVGAGGLRIEADGRRGLKLPDQVGQRGLVLDDDGSGDRFAGPGRGGCPCGLLIIAEHAELPGGSRRRVRFARRGQAADQAAELQGAEQLGDAVAVVIMGDAGFQVKRHRGVVADAGQLAAKEGHLPALFQLLALAGR